VALQHTKDTVIKVNSVDLSTYVTTSQLEKTADSHDVTTYGKDSHVFAPGLKNGTATMSGLYDTTAVSGPRAALEPLVGAAAVPLVRQPEGTGSGKPQDAVDVLVIKYVETAPVADYATWSCDMQLSDDVDSTAQSA
jgi:hypothetical protein